MASQEERPSLAPVADAITLWRGSVALWRGSVALWRGSVDNVDDLNLDNLWPTQIALPGSGGPFDRSSPPAP